MFKLLISRFSGLFLPLSLPPPPPPLLLPSPSPTKLVLLWAPQLVCSLKQVTVGYKQPKNKVAFWSDNLIVGFRFKKIFSKKKKHHRSSFSEVDAAEKRKLPSVVGHRHLFFSLLPFLRNFHSCKDWGRRRWRQGGGGKEGKGGFCAGYPRRREWRILLNLHTRGRKKEREREGEGKKSQEKKQGM